MSRGSDLARALANNRTKILASSDRLPPTSKTRTTRRARASRSDQLRGMFFPCLGELLPVRLRHDLRLLSLVRHRP